MKNRSIHAMQWTGRQALREMARQRLPWYLAGVGLAMVLGTGLLRELNFGKAEQRFLRDFAEAVLVLGGTVLALLLPVGLLQGEMARSSLVLTTVRGVRRGEWLLGRWLAVAGVLVGLAALGHLLMAIMLRRYGHEMSWSELAEATLRLSLRLWLTAGFALMASVLARSAMLAWGMAIGLTLVAQLADIMGWAGQRAGAAWSWLGHFVPVFAVIDGASPWSAAIYALAYTGLFVGLACWAFLHRET